MDLLLLQNIVGRITHGLIGFDLIMQGKDGSKYLADFLSLEEPELDAAFNFASINLGFVPADSEYSSKEKQELKEVIRRARAIAEKGGKMTSQEAKEIISNLYEKMDFLYRGLGAEKTSVMQY